MDFKAFSIGLIGSLLLGGAAISTAQDLKMEPRFSIGKGKVLGHRNRVSSYIGKLEARDSVTRAAFSRDHRPTYRFGTYLSASIGDGVSLRTGLHYRIMGWKDHYELDIEEGGKQQGSKEIRSEGKVRIGEVVLPLFIRYQKEMELLFFFGSAGLDLPFRVRRNLSYKEEVTTSSGSQLPGPGPGGIGGSGTDATEWRVKLDGLPVIAPSISGEFGGGVRLGKGRLAITFRMSSGFGASFYSSDEELSRNGALPSGVYTKKGQERLERDHGLAFGDLRFGSWSLGIGYRFPL